MARGQLEWEGALWDKGTQAQSGRRHYQKTAIYVYSSCTIVCCLVPALATSLMAHHSLCSSANHLEKPH